MRLTLCKSRSKLFQPSPLQGDTTACFVLGSVCVRYRILVYLPTLLNSPQLSIILGRVGFVTQAVRFTCILLHMPWGNTFTYAVGISISKTIMRQCSSSEWLSRQRQCSETAQNEFHWWQQQGWPGTFVMSPPIGIPPTHC